MNIYFVSIHLLDVNKISSMASNLFDSNGNNPSESSQSDTNSTLGMERFNVLEDNVSETELDSLRQAEATFNAILSTTKITTYTFTPLSNQECIQLFEGIYYLMQTYICICICRMVVCTFVQYLHTTRHQSFI